ncbi:MAG TPA: hypothetical protein VG028_21525 [Terriglobia bacterium]|nr:hypothetical protein [Terriglobia bacterium]
MFKFRTAIMGLILITGMTCPARAADPDPINPVKGLFRPALGAEFEVYTGGITGQSVGAAFKSAAQGDYGLRFTFQILKSFSLSANYMYSNQTRTLTEALPPVGGLPTGTIVAHAANMNMVFGNGEFDFLHTKSAVLYISPGVGFVRNGSRNLSLATPFGEASFPLGAGTAMTFNLGTGVKIYPRKHWGIRLDARDFVSGGGTGALSPQIPPGVNLCTIQLPNCNNLGSLLGNVPVNNNLVFTVGLIFRLF